MQVRTSDERKRAVGKPMPRLDARDKVTGVYVYGMDISQPGMLHGKVVRSPHPHALIRKVDASQAEKLPGVRAILTGHDIPGLLMRNCVGPTLAGVRRVRYFGEPVAAIAADSLEIAESAARLISIEYEPFRDHRSRGCHATRRAARARSLGSLPGGKIARQRWQRVLPFQPAQGGHRPGFAEADYLFEDSFTTESVPPIARGARGHWLDRAGWQGDCTTNTQLPYWIRTNVAHALGVEEEAVRIVPTGIGGGVGSKLYPQLEPIVALLARAAGRPVRIVTPASKKRSRPALRAIPARFPQGRREARRHDRRPPGSRSWTRAPTPAPAPSWHSVACLVLAGRTASPTSM